MPSPWRALGHPAWPPEVSGAMGTCRGLGSEELARGGLGFAVPHHGHDFSRVDHGPPGLALKSQQAVRAELHAGQLLVPGCDEPDVAGSADNQGNRTGLTDEGPEQVADRLTGHRPSPPLALRTGRPEGRGYAHREGCLLDGGASLRAGAASFRAGAASSRAGAASSRAGAASSRAGAASSRAGASREAAQLTGLATAAS